MRKLFLSLLIAVCGLSCALAFVACTYEESGHKWSKKWSHNERYHWHDCLDSDCSLRDSLAAHIWKLEVATESPTCNTAGVGTYSCEVCGEKKEDEVPATGAHLWREYDRRNPSCYLDGFVIHECRLCHTFAEEIIPATGNHYYNEEWVGTDMGHYHTCKTAHCSATTEIEPHNVAEEPLRTVPAQPYHDGMEYYGCTECGHVTRTVELGATDIPYDLVPYIAPCYTPIVAGTLKPKWTGEEPLPEIVKESDGVYSVTVVRDSGISSPEYPYEIYFTGTSPLTDESIEVPIWHMGSTYGITGYRYTSTTQNRTIIDAGTNPIAFFAKETNTNQGYIRLRSAGSITLQFVFNTADDSDRHNQKDRTSIFLKVTVVEYASIMPTSLNQPLPLAVNNYDIFVENKYVY
ncbi:MAG: hypothetical protein J1G05_03125 [Clostridiales bacterium]|nr:hypothetical protein [Clostridiales bacterium]